MKEYQEKVKENATSQDITDVDEEDSNKDCLYLYMAFLYLANTKNDVNVNH